MVSDPVLDLLASTATYLPDTSALMRLHQPAVAKRLRAIPAQRLLVCTPVLLEAGVSARTAAEHATLMRTYLAGAQRAYLLPEIEDRAVQVQGLLAQRGQHRSARLADLLIAAVAESRRATLLHYDADFDLVADLTGQPCEWVVERGSVP